MLNFECRSVAVALLALVVLSDNHDRAIGESVQPQEYALIEIKLSNKPAFLARSTGDLLVFLLADTLRPESMYGQTNRT